MKINISIPIMLASALAAAGCKKSTQSPSTLTHEPAGAGRAKPAKREVAKGELREALLRLQRVHFALDSDELLPASRDSLERAAKQLANHPDVQIFVDGHTDDRGTTEYNIALGDRRAAMVVDYLARLGIARDRLHRMTFGEERPYRDGETGPARAANRRVEFRLMRGDAQLLLEDGPQYTDRGTSMDASSSLSSSVRSDD